MQLSTDQQHEIFNNGFAVLRDIVPRALVDEALRAINHSLGTNGMPPDELPILRAQTYCREVTHTTAISDLFNATPLHKLCESALGEDGFLPVTGGQIALRFPAHPSKRRVPAPHLDGTSSPTNGVVPGTYGNFTALLGVLLSDLPTCDRGNFTVWPGTHRAYEKYFQQHGVEKFLEGTPPIDLPEPQQVVGRAGDAVLCHYQLGHAVAPNLSPHIRYAIFFRLQHRRHDEHRHEVLADIWRDWPGFAALTRDE
jgi:hypothetical protein